jgi:hypothetical protein
LHGPEEVGYPAITEAMVNIRATLDQAVAEGVLDNGLAVRLTEIGKSLFYKERCWDAILQLATSGGLPTTPLERFEAWMQSSWMDQKRIDALEMIAVIRTFLASSVKRLSTSYQFHDTGYHKAAMDQLRRAEAGCRE